MNEELLTVMQRKWHPLTHAIFNGNLNLVKAFFASETAHFNGKKAVKVPGLQKTNEVNKLFPFYIALTTNNDELFSYFWEHERSMQWNEDTFESLFKLMAKREASHLLTNFIKSRTTLAIFSGMSYTYRGTFI